MAEDSETTPSILRQKALTILPDESFPRLEHTDLSYAIGRRDSPDILSIDHATPSREYRPSRQATSGADQ